MRPFCCYAAVLLAMGAALFTMGCHEKPTGAAPIGQAAPALFSNVAESAGIRYEWVIPDKRPLNILQTIGNGCAFLDYDNDGNLDILLVGPKLALYKGDGKGRFTDVTHQAGLDRLHGHFLGCAVGDYDNDGYPDVYLTAYRGGALLHNEATYPPTPSLKGRGAPPPQPSPKNRGGRQERETPPPVSEVSASATPFPVSAANALGKGAGGLGRFFHNVTAQAGITPQPWGTSAAFVETVPGSGRLDLVVANYAHFGKEPGIPQLCEQKSVHGTSIMTSCGPRQYMPLKAVLFRNLGGRFASPVTLTMVSGRGLGVAACDYDGSGQQGLAFANDETAGNLLQNSGRGTFRDIGAVSGTAYDRDGNIHGGMGVDWGDYDNDGKPDLLVTTFQNEPKSLYHNDGSGSFTDASYPSGLGSATYANVAFGCKFLDYDNDGRLDIVIANGHVQDNIAEIDSSTTYRQSLQLFRNRGAGEGGRVTFEETSQQAGPDFARKIVGRGLATGDYDNDGRIDLLVVDSEGKPLLLYNDVRNGHHWLGVRLIGTRSNRDGYGATVTAQAGGFKLTRLCHADGSYMSSSDPRLLFGLGTADKVENLTIRWPSGQTDRLTNLPIDRYVTIREGQGIMP